MNINKETCADFAGDQWSLHWARPADVAVPSLQPAVGLDLHSACSAAVAPGNSWIGWIFLDDSLVSDTSKSGLFLQENIT